MQIDADALHAEAHVARHIRADVIALHQIARRPVDDGDARTVVARNQVAGGDRCAPDAVVARTLNRHPGGEAVGIGRGKPAGADGVAPQITPLNDVIAVGDEPDGGIAVGAEKAVQGQAADGAAAAGEVKAVAAALGEQVLAVDFDERPAVKARLGGAVNGDGFEDARQRRGQRNRTQIGIGGGLHQREAGAPGDGNKGRARAAATGSGRPDLPPPAVLSHRHRGQVRQPSLGGHRWRLVCPHRRSEDAESAEGCYSLS